MTLHWFEHVEEMLYEIYKNAIKTFPQYLDNVSPHKPYTHMLMEAEAGLNGRYKIGLDSNVEAGGEWQIGWEGMKPNLEDFDDYSPIADFFKFENFEPTEDDLDRYAEEDLYQFYNIFEGFLGHIIMRKIGARLRQDKELQEHISPKTIIYTSYEFASLPCNLVMIPLSERVAAIDKLVGKAENKKLILDLWEGQLNDVGKAFLELKGFV